MGIDPWEVRLHASTLWIRSKRWEIRRNTSTSWTGTKNHEGRQDTWTLWNRNNPREVRSDVSTFEAHTTICTTSAGRRNLAPLEGPMNVRHWYAIIRLAEGGRWSSRVWAGGDSLNQPLSSLLNWISHVHSHSQIREHPQDTSGLLHISALRWPQIWEMTT